AAEAEPVDAADRLAVDDPHPGRPRRLEVVPAELQQVGDVRDQAAAGTPRPRVRAFLCVAAGPGNVGRAFERGRLEPERPQAPPAQGLLVGGPGGARAEPAGEPVAGIRVRPRLLDT